jgi:hypothetical protein
LIIQNNYLLQCLDFGTICRLSNHHNRMSEFLVIPRQDHDALVSKAYQSHGYTEEESAEGAKLAAEAARHGIRTHHALKASASLSSSTGKSAT